MIKTILIIAGIIIALAAILFVWNLSYRRYIKKVRSDYQKDILDFDNITTKSSAVERLLKLYWSRQQTYEFSGYTILLVCILFLLGGIYVFIFSGRFVTFSGIKPDNSNDFWISLLSLRIGISLIIFFICQILLRLYRYCVRFAVFYIGLFDSLLIYKEIGKDLKDTIDMFMPNVDIGDAPQSPTSEIVQALANLEKGKSGSGGSGKG